MLTYEEVCRLAECLIAEAVDQSENYGSVVDAFDCLLDNVYDTHSHENAQAIMVRANCLARESGIIGND